MDTNIVRLRILSKAHGFYIVKSLPKSFADSMHPIHQPAITRKNHWERKIAVKH